MSKNIIYIRYDQIHKINITYTNTNKNLLHILNNLIIKDINKYKTNLIINTKLKKDQLRIELKYNNKLFDNIRIKTYIIFTNDQILKHINNSIQIIKKQIKIKVFNEQIIYIDPLFKIELKQFINKIESILNKKRYINFNSTNYVTYLYIKDQINYIKNNYSLNNKELNKICNNIFDQLEYI